MTVKEVNDGRSYESLISLAKRIIVPITASSTSQQLAESQEDPWSQAGQYGLGWVYFSIVLLSFTIVLRIYHMWGDKTRAALGKLAMDSDHADTAGQGQELPSAATDSSTKQLFSSPGSLSSTREQQHSVSGVVPLNKAIAFARWIFYRPIPVLRVGKLQITPPSLGVAVIVFVAFAFVTLYCFVPRPLYYSSIAYGSPPLAIRAGMIAVSMVPWIVALGTKASLLSIITGIGHERLNVLHRWLSYLCLFLSLIHTIPFYVTPVWDDGALPIFQMYLPGNMYIYGTGIAVLAPLAFLCVHSLPILRSRMYELFVFAHAPVALIFLAMLFWHTKNFLGSWGYLWATLSVWLLSCFTRVLYLNWSSPLRLSWLIGEDAAVTILPENAVKVTIPTEMRWKPGQYVYLRMPGISPFENHPFTIASLCSGDFPSNYGPEYRDMALVFRPFRGFTRKVLRTAMKKGPYKIYRAFLDGPYGGMHREMAAFDDVVFLAGGSGITAIASQLLDLIKKMRDGKAATKSVRVIWALKHPAVMEWFKEELRICREYAPSNSVHCQFFLTGMDRATSKVKMEDMLLDAPTKRNSSFIREEAAGDQAQEKELRRENEDAITALPMAHFVPTTRHSRYPPSPVSYFTVPSSCSLDPIPSPIPSPSGMTSQSHFTQFAYLPILKQDSWHTEYGRPNITGMLQELSKTFGRRTCVFVCGPPSMRVEVANTVARLQQLVLTDSSKDEIFLHAENYAI